MRALSRLIAKLSAPGLFVLLVGPVFLFQVGATVGEPIGMAGSVVAILVWLAWHAGMIGQISSLQQRSIPLAYFVLVAVAVIYVVSILVAATVAVASGDSELLALSTRIEAHPALLVPVHLAAMAGLVYSAWLAARRLVDAELGSMSTWDRTVGTWLLIWFFPIGVWFVQPRFRRAANVA
jgi:hypothetical protein